MITFTLAELQAWARQERVATKMASSLRVREINSIVSALKTGAINEAQAARTVDNYHLLWGDSPVPGVLVTEDMSPKEVLLQMKLRYSRNVMREKHLPITIPKVKSGEKAIVEDQPTNNEKRPLTLAGEPEE